MREPEGQHGPAWGLPAPELGELPQAEEQALLDPHGVGDRGADGEPARPPQGAIGQGLEELRCLPGPHGEWLVEDSDRGRLEDRPGLPRERCRVILPGAEQVAPPEKLQAAAALGHQDRGDRSDRRGRGSRGGRRTAPAHPAPRVHARASSRRPRAGLLKAVGGRGSQSSHAPARGRARADQRGRVARSRG